MSTVDDLKQEANTYRKSRSYAAALPIYQKLWDEHRSECNEWDGWGYAFCLRKLDRSAEAILVCRDLHKQYPDFEPVRDLYGWSVYDTEIAPAPDDPVSVDEGRLLRAANFILDLSDPSSKFSPYVRTVFKVIDYYKARSSPSTAQLLAWTEKLTPDQLSDEPGWGKNPKTGRPMAFASDREKWYAVRLKVLLDDGQYEECIRLGNEAVTRIPTLHHDNDVWFKWRMALAYLELGELETALKLFLEMASQKPDWFIRHRLAETYHALGNDQEAISHAVNAALARGDLEHKWKLFYLMATLYQEMDATLAREHLLLAVTIHQEQGWKLPDELQTAMQEVEIDPNNLPSSQDLHKQLRKQWKAAKFEGQTQYQGAISNILSHGKAAFIGGDNGEDYYFKTNDFKGPKHKLTEGQRVKFYAEPNPNPDQCDNAINVEPV